MRFQKFVPPRTANMFLSLATALFMLPYGAGAEPIPRIYQGHLYVDGKPFLILGGELANSSSARRALMAPMWQRLRASHLNTVLMPVSWELLEPRDNRFDFRLVDGLLHDARAAHLRIVILWFGSWKNGQSSYAPLWIKKDTATFPRVRTNDGRALEVLTPFSPRNMAADARAFAALMAHLSRTDTHRTCIMVQVENEIGLMPISRDHSPEAQIEWSLPVPAELDQGDRGWVAAYADRADEAFMAYGFAHYVEQVAKAGKAQYKLPLYINASVSEATGKQAGQDYPSGDPLPDVAEIWKREAPSIDLLAPDIYPNDFSRWAAIYAKFNPLFVPEANWAGATDGPANALQAFGKYAAIGISPFSVDTVNLSSRREMSEVYGMLDRIASLILSRQGGSDIAGFRPIISADGKADLSPQSVIMGQHIITAHFTDPWYPQVEHEPENRSAILIMLGPDKFLAAGKGVTFTFTPVTQSGSDGIAEIDKGLYEQGEWKSSQRLNGDDSYAGRHVRLPFDQFTTLQFELYHYQ